MSAPDVVANRATNDAPAPKCRHEWATSHTPETRWTITRRARDVGPRGGRLKTWHDEPREMSSPSRTDHAWKQAEEVCDEQDGPYDPPQYAKTFYCVHCPATAIVGHISPVSK